MVARRFHRPVYRAVFRLRLEGPDASIVDDRLHIGVPGSCRSSATRCAQLSGPDPLMAPFDGREKIAGFFGV